ncbi:MAG: hypothetical protein GDA48_06970 [Hormoscilla sp. GM102CHS1]|nr:hypothetical protein [Hormoscilla sp. GM102CHS1]
MLREPNSEGSVPLREFQYSSSLCKLLREPNSEGSVPLREFRNRSRTCKLLREPNSEGSARVRSEKSIKCHSGDASHNCRHPDDTIKIWSLETFREIATLTGHSSSVISSPDGKTLASGSDNKTIKIWSLETFREIATLTGTKRLESTKVLTTNLLSRRFAPGKH